MSYVQNETFFEALPEFLAWEERQEECYESIGGKIFATVGASLAHNIIIPNLCHALRPVLKKPHCRVFSEGVKLTRSNKSLSTIRETRTIVPGSSNYWSHQP